MKKLFNLVKGGVDKVAKSKYKHIAGFLVFVMVIGMFGGFRGTFYHSSGIDSSSMNNVQADIYSAYKYTAWDAVSDSISGVLAGAGASKSESINSSYAPSYAPEAPMEDMIVSEKEYLSNTTTSTITVSDEKLVYSASVGVETKDIDKALEHIYAKIKEYNGIIQDERQSNMGNVVYDDWYRYGGNASAYIFVRIPQEHYDVFLNSIEVENGDIVVSNLSKSVQNMTQTYYDTESRLRSLRIQEERLFEFMENAYDISDMLDVEDRLTDVQYEIDSATNSLRTIDNDVAYSKVTLNIEEVVKYTSTPENPKNFFERVWSYITGSVEDFAETLEYWLEVAIYLIPYLFVLIVIYIAFIKVKRKVQAKRKAKKALKDKENEIDIE